VQAYQCLRDIVRRHINSGILPLLSESPKPRGGYQAAEAQGGVLSELLQENAQFVRRQEDAAFMQNVENVLVAERENFDLFQDGEGNDWDGRNINQV
jgi:hypothetical protein